MLVIRLARTGRNKYPTYRIVAAESARAATGRHIAVLGNYNPHTKELNLKTDDIKKHLGNGAQPSNTVVKLLQREKVELPAWVKLKTKAPKAVAEAEVIDAEVTAAEAEGEAAEAPAEVAETEVPEAVAAAEDVRVGEVVEDAAAEAGDDAPNIGTTETAASDEAQAGDTEAAQDAANDAKDAPAA